MTRSIDATHDPARRSWLASANAPGCDFPIQNLPYCVFSSGAGAGRIGVGIGDAIADLAGLCCDGVLAAEPPVLAAASRETLNELMALGPTALSALRSEIARVLDANAPGATRERVARRLVPIDDVQLLLPAAVGDYTDFLTSRWHTERHGRLKGLQDPLPAAFFSMPVAYHGRSSSIRPSGTPVRRPQGQSCSAGGPVRFGPSAALDFELELAAYVGLGNALGCPVPIAEAESHIFGYGLLNDWSAKDIQWWEQVLGPFLGKSFMTSISPWVVTAQALAPFRTALDPRPEGAPQALPHLQDDGQALDVSLEAWIHTARMRNERHPPVRLAASHPRHLAWTFGQMLAHHTSNGCNLRPGDVLGSGTVSGESPSSMGCMTEMTCAGRSPIALPFGEERRWLEDGDEVILRARAQRSGFVAIGFGECRGLVVGAG